MFEAIGYCVLFALVVITVVAVVMAIKCNNKKQAERILRRATIIIVTIVIPYLTGATIYVLHQIAASL